MPLRAWLVGVVLLLGLPSGAAGQAELYHEGNRLYQEGDFAAALASYLRVNEAGYESGDLHYNLGNAYFKTGDLARAILHYERARQSLPGDEDVLQNLRLATSLTADDIEPLPRFWLLTVLDRWLHLLPGLSLVVLVAAAYVTTGTGVVLLLLRPSSGMARAGRSLALAAGIITLVFGSTLLARELGVGQPEEGVVMVEEVNVQSAPSEDQNLTAFRIHAGTKVRVSRRSGEWIEIVLEDGTVGWVTGDVLETI